MISYLRIYLKPVVTLQFDFNIKLVKIIVKKIIFEGIIIIRTSKNSVYLKTLFIIIIKSMSEFFLDIKVKFLI